MSAPGLLEHLKYIRTGKKVISGFLRLAAPDIHNKLSRILSSCHADKMLYDLAVHTALFPLQHGNDLVDLALYLFFILQYFQAFQ